MLGRVTFITFTEFGAVGDGVTDDRQAIQNAIDAAATVAHDNPNRRVVVFGPDGTYAIKAAIQGRKDVAVLCSPGCVFLASGPIKADFTRIAFTGVTDATWTGGTFLRLREDITGNIFEIGPDGAGVESERITIRDPIIRGWDSPGGHVTAWSMGRAFAVHGNDIRILNPNAYDPVDDTGAGGLRVTGGRRILCSGGRIEAGDDAVALTPSDVGQPDNLYGNTDVEDVTVDDMVLQSKQARAINVGMSLKGPEPVALGLWHYAEDASHNPTYYLTSSVRRARFTNIVATALGDRCIRIHNDVSSGVIEDIALANVALRTGPKSTNAVIVENSAGGVRRIRFDDVSVFGDPTTAADQEMFRVEGVDGFVMTGERFDATVGNGRRQRMKSPEWSGVPGTVTPTSIRRSARPSPFTSASTNPPS